MKKTKWLVISGILGALALGIWGITQMPVKDGLSRPEQLLEEIRHGLRPELAKLLLVLEHFRESNAQVIYDGTPYTIKSALNQARSYLKRNYNGEAAETWIVNHLSLSPDQGELIMFKFPDGRQVPLRDLLLEELRRLPV